MTVHRAALVTEISDRESDIYEKWAYLPEPGFHILTRANKDRSIKEGGGNLSTAPLQPGDTADAEPIVWRLLTTHAVEDGYPKSEPPGPITLRHGLESFRAIAYGWKLRDV